MRNASHISSPSPEATRLAFVHPQSPPAAVRAIQGALGARVTLRWIRLACVQLNDAASLREDATRVPSLASNRSIDIGLIVQDTLWESAILHKPEFVIHG